MTGVLQENPKEISLRASYRLTYMIKTSQVHRKSVFEVVQDPFWGGHLSVFPKGGITSLLLKLLTELRWWRSHVVL